MIRNASLLLAAGALFASLAVPASAQTPTPQTTLDKHLSRLDLGLSGIGQFNKSVSGVNAHNGAFDQDHNITINASNTLGFYGNLRYVAKPLVGLEFNYTYARYTETLTNNTGTSDLPVGPLNPGQIQTGVNEFSFGYVITPRTEILGLHPFITLDAGSTRFRPTKGGGQGSPTQWRATYSYNVGVQKEFGADSHFGVRASFRQAFFKAPDFLLNYLTINKQTSTIEPTIGVYARF